jgi:hypothetical protein
MKKEKRIEIVKDYREVAESFTCDECGKTLPPLYPDTEWMPEGWGSVFARSDYGYGEQQVEDCHFCSPKCMVKWLRAVDYLDEYTLEVSSNYIKEMLKHTKK